MEPSLGELKGFFEEELLKNLKRPTQGEWSSKRLFESMNYALLSPGKRIRPLMVLASALAVNRTRSVKSVLRQAMPSALSIEYIHTYSLIHDDLPAMDNDDYRRGRLSVHRQFDEALAILTGDALLSDAFLMALSSPHNPVTIARELALASGSSALVSGQAEDLNRFDGAKDFSQWLSINNAKTARLFGASAVMGGLSQDATEEELALLREFGQAFGMAFQIRDDAEDKQGLSYHVPKAEIHLLKTGRLEIASSLAQKLSNTHMLTELIQVTFDKLGSS